MTVIEMLISKFLILNALQIFLTAFLIMIG